MSTHRLEAFSDGVIAIIITIMVFKIQAPGGNEWGDFLGVLPAILTYAMSFLYLAIYWNNHHHLLHVATGVNGGVLWANLLLLFWLSLFPFATDWMWRSDFAAVPTAVYGGGLLLAGIAYRILGAAIVRMEGEASVLRKAVGIDWKGLASLAFYSIAVALSFVSPAMAILLYVAVAALWIIPDRRIERALVGPPG